VRRPIRGTLLLLAVLVLPGIARGQAAGPDPRIAIEDGPTGAAIEVLDATGLLPFPVAVRVEASDVSPADALGARLAGLITRNSPIWLAIDAPASESDVTAWRTRLQGLLAAHGTGITVLEIRVSAQPAAVARFAVQAAATDAGVRGRRIRVAIGGSAMVDDSQRAAIYTEGLAPYVDLLAVPADRQADLETWLQSLDPQAAFALLPSAASDAAPADMVAGALAQAGSRAMIRAWRATPSAPAALHALVPVAGMLAHELVVIGDREAALTMNAGGAETGVEHRLLFDTQTFATYLAYWGARADTPLTVELSVRAEGPPRLFDLMAGDQTLVRNAEIDASGQHARLRLPLTGQPMFVNFNDGSRPLADTGAVSADATLSVTEIIARHQRQQRSQDALVEHYAARARMEQHFRPTIADPGYDVVTESTYFSARDGVEWAEDSFSVNGSRWGADRPPFPLLQPEKVLALPLLLRFDEGYTYRLVGEDRVDGFDCYVVRFEPLREDPALYAGTVWIDRRSFARVRVQAVRSNLPAPVISNDETHEYRIAATIDGQPIFLFSRLDARQIMLVAGRNLLVEKRVTFTDFRVNGTDFEAARTAARESEAVMFRETPDGLRYYVKEEGERVVRDQPTQDLKALAMGVTLDPSYSFPLPIFGLNYLNFRFRNPDTQLAVLFAGVLVAGNIQRSNFGARNLDASVDFFAIAAPSGDRLYGPTGEDPSGRVLTWPLSTGANLGWQASPFQKLTLQYQFRFDGFVADRTTAPDFAVPSSTITNGIGGAWEYRRAGYSFVSNAAWYRRAAWQPWGQGVVTSPRFTKYSAALSRDFYLDAFQKLHFNGSWFGSRNADRFSKYQFGMFEDTRIHGVPSSGVRYAELAMVRSSWSVNIFQQYRVDLFLEHAWGREDAGRGPWNRIPAVGAAINVRAPWDTMLRVDAGKSWLPGRFDRLGSATLQVMLLKPLR
jgi:hypothetical protein